VNAVVDDLSASNIEELLNRRSNPRWNDNFETRYLINDYASAGASLDLWRRRR